MIPAAGYHTAAASRSSALPGILETTPQLTAYVILPLIGLVAGVLGGLLGIGGGLIIIPALLLTLGSQHYGPGSLHLYKLAALATAIVLSIPAAMQHVRAGAVVKRFLPPLEAFAVAGVVIGVLLAGQLAGDRTRQLQRVFGLTMLLFVAAQVWLDWRRTQRGATGVASCPAPSRWGLIGGFVGLPAGVISGLLGIGGGVWAVPAQNLGLGVRLNNAIANSTCMILGVAAAASLAQSIALSAMADDRMPWTEGWRLAMLLSPGAVIGGWLGGYLAHRLPTRTLRYLFFGALSITGLRLL